MDRVLRGGEPWARGPCPGPAGASLSQDSCSGAGCAERARMDQALGGRKLPQCAALFKKINSKRRMQNEVRHLPPRDGSLGLRRLPGHPHPGHLCVSASPALSLVKAGPATAHSATPLSTAVGPRPTPARLRTLRPALAALSRALRPDLALGDPSFFFPPMT